MFLKWKDEIVQNIGRFLIQSLIWFPLFSRVAVHLAKSSYSFFIPSGADPRDPKSPPQSPQGLVGSATYCSPYNNPTPCGIFIFHCSAIKLTSSALHRRPIEKETRSILAGCSGSQLNIFMQITWGAAAELGFRNIVKYSQDLRSYGILRTLDDIRTTTRL